MIRLHYKSHKGLNWWPLCWIRQVIFIVLKMCEEKVAIFAWWIKLFMQAMKFCRLWLIRSSSHPIWCGNNLKRCESGCNLILVGLKPECRLLLAALPQHLLFSVSSRWFIIVSNYWFFFFTNLLWSSALAWGLISRFWRNIQKAAILQLLLQISVLFLACYRLFVCFFSVSISLFSPVFSCPSRSASQLLPSPNSDHIRRIIVSSFLSLPSESPTYWGDGGYSHLEDPEVAST